MRDCITFRFVFSNCFWPKGSSERPKSPKSKLASVGTSGDFGIADPDACLLAARLAAFAFAICSRNAADDFLDAGWGASSAESTVRAVDTVEALERFRSSLDVIEYLIDGTDILGTGRMDKSDDVKLVEVGLTNAGIDGFLNRPFTEARGFRALAVIVLDPYLETDGSKSFSGLGVRGPMEAERDAFDCSLLEAEDGFIVGVFVIVGVFAMEDVLLVGVPCTVDSGGLYEFVDALELLCRLSDGPELEPGRLNGRDMEPSD